jgi:hypothetical protein
MLNKERKTLNVYRNFKCLSPIPTLVKIRAIRCVVFIAKTY